MQYQRKIEEQTEPQPLSPAVPEPIQELVDQSFYDPLPMWEPCTWGLPSLTQLDEEAESNFMEKFAVLD